MKKTKKQKEAIERGIEEQDAYYRRKLEEEKRKKNKIEDPARPSLIKRIAGIALDAVIVLGTIVAIQFGLYFSLYHPMGYFKEEKAIQTLVEESHLFVKNELGRNSDLITAYDSKKTPEENYDGALTYYYTVNARAIEDGKLAIYENAKINSGYFEKDSEGNIVRTASATDENVKDLLENLYTSAVKYLKADPIYVDGSNKTLMISIGTVMINSLLVTMIFYLIIPLATKENRTIGQIACGLVLVNDKDKSKVKNDQIIMRYMLNYVINFLLPISIYIAFPSYAGMPWFISLGVICFTKNFDSFPGLVSHTKVINASRTNAMETLKQIKEMGEQTNQMM